MATSAVASPPSRTGARSVTPSSVAAPSRVAAQVSPRIGSNTTPASRPSASSHAMLTHHCGIPNRKFTVPSSGSTIQRRPLVPGRSSPSSPRIASAGRAAWSRARISRSVCTSASETRSVGVLFALIDEAAPAVAEASERVAQTGTSLVRDRGGQSQQLVLEAHAANGGRRAVQPMSASSWAESESSVASSSGRPTSCTATGKPSGAVSTGTDAAGWPRWFHSGR